MGFSFPQIKGKLCRESGLDKSEWGKVVFLRGFEGLSCVRRGVRKGILVIMGTALHAAVALVVVCGSVFMRRTFVMEEIGPGGIPEL